MSWLSHWLHELLIGGRRRRTAVGRRLSRNELCPCGSGKKYKRCCLSSDWRNRVSVYQNNTAPLIAILPLQAEPPRLKEDLVDGIYCGGKIVMMAEIATVKTDN